MAACYGRTSSTADRAGERGVDRGPVDHGRVDGRTKGAETRRDIRNGGHERHDVAANASAGLRLAEVPKGANAGIWRLIRMSIN